MAKQSEHLQNSFLKCRTLIKSITELKAIGNKHTTREQLVDAIREVYAAQWDTLEYSADVIPYLQMSTWDQFDFLFMIMYELVTDVSEEVVKEHFWSYAVLLSQNLASIEFKFEGNDNFYTIGSKLREDANVKRCREVVESMFLIKLPLTVNSFRFLAQPIDSAPIKLAKNSFVQSMMSHVWLGMPEKSVQSSFEYPEISEQDLISWINMHIARFAGNSKFSKFADWSAVHGNSMEVPEEVLTKIFLLAHADFNSNRVYLFTQFALLLALGGRSALQRDTTDKEIMVNFCKLSANGSWEEVYAFVTSNFVVTGQHKTYIDDNFTKLTKIFYDTVTQYSYEALVSRVINAIESSAPAALKNDAVEALAIAMCVDE